MKDIKNKTCQPIFALYLDNLPSKSETFRISNTALKME